MGAFGRFVAVAAVLCCDALPLMVLLLSLGQLLMQFQEMYWREDASANARIGLLLWRVLSGRLRWVGVLRGVRGGTANSLRLASRLPLVGRRWRCWCQVWRVWVVDWRCPESDDAKLPLSRGVLLSRRRGGTWRVRLFLARCGGRRLLLDVVLTDLRLLLLLCRRLGWCGVGAVSLRLLEGDGLALWTGHFAAQYDEFCRDPVEDLASIRDELFDLGEAVVEGHGVGLGIC